MLLIDNQKDIPFEPCGSSGISPSTFPDPPRGKVFNRHRLPQGFVHKESIPIGTQHDEPSPLPSCLPPLSGPSLTEQRDDTHKYTYVYTSEQQQYVCTNDNNFPRPMSE